MLHRIPLSIGQGTPYRTPTPYRMPCQGDTMNRLDLMTDAPRPPARAHCNLCKRGKGTPCATFGTICKRCAVELKEFIDVAGTRADAATLAALEPVFH
jgi:hypothetical protein